MNQETADTAFVKFKISDFKDQGETISREVKLEKQDGAWKLVLGKPMLKTKS